MVVKVVLVVGRLVREMVVNVVPALLHAVVTAVMVMVMVVVVMVLVVAQIAVVPGGARSCVRRGAGTAVHHGSRM